MSEVKADKLVIDVVGLPGSGKSSICKYLRDRHGFSLYSPSDALREYAAQHGRTLSNRQDYIKCHEALIEDDPLAIIRPVLDSTAKRICLDGMRAPAPFIKLRERFGARLVYLDCPLEERFARMQADASRTGHRSLPTLEAFTADESPDYHNPNPNLPNMEQMKRLADFVIDASQPFGAEIRALETALSLQAYS